MPDIDFNVALINFDGVELVEDGIAVTVKQVCVNYLLGGITQKQPDGREVIVKQLTDVELMVRYELARKLHNSNGLAVAVTPQEIILLNDSLVNCPSILVRGQIYELLNK